MIVKRCLLLFLVLIFSGCASTRPWQAADRNRRSVYHIQAGESPEIVYFSTARFMTVAIAGVGVGFVAGNLLMVPAIGCGVAGWTAVVEMKPPRDFDFSAQIASNVVLILHREAPELIVVEDDSAVRTNESTSIAYIEIEIDFISILKKPLSWSRYELLVQAFVAVRDSEGKLLARLPFSYRSADYGHQCRGKAFFDRDSDLLYEELQFAAQKAAGQFANGLMGRDGQE